MYLRHNDCVVLTNKPYNSLDSKTMAVAFLL